VNIKCNTSCELQSSVTSPINRLNFVLMSIVLLKKYSFHFTVSLKNLTFDRREETEEFESGHFDDDGYPDLSQADEGEFVECNVCVEEEDGPHKPTASTSKRKF